MKERREKERICGERVERGKAKGKGTRKKGARPFSPLFFFFFLFFLFSLKIAEASPEDIGDGSARRRRRRRSFGRLLTRSAHARGAASAASEGWICRRLRAKIFFFFLFRYYQSPSPALHRESSQQLFRQSQSLFQLP